MKEILKTLSVGGYAYHFDLDMHVLAAFDTLQRKEIYLGDLDTRKAYIVLNGDEINLDDFILTVD